ncbi:hypothetical protein [Streptosporangium sp. H16]|uniref:hypothetical protein n=1 Tax=Streptosporangium sp. H16 TaxID=3444184 RepID=UPI003F7ACF45
MRILHSVRIALAVTAVCAASALISQAVRAPSSVPASCPERWDGDRPGGWVPAAADLDGVEESLVPGEPVTAMICAYPGHNARPGGERLAGSRILTAEAGAMARDLDYLPVTTADPGGPCTQGGGAMTNYLIGYLRGGPRLQAGEESDFCGAGQEKAIRRQADRRREHTRFLADLAVLCEAWRRP